MSLLGTRWTYESVHHQKGLYSARIDAAVIAVRATELGDQRRDTQHAVAGQGGAVSQQGREPGPSAACGCFLLYGVVGGASLCRQYRVSSKPLFALRTLVVYTLVDRIDT